MFFLLLLDPLGGIACEHIVDIAIAAMDKVPIVIDPPDRTALLDDPIFYMVQIILIPGDLLQDAGFYLL